MSNNGPVVPRWEAGLLIFLVIACSLYLIFEEQRAAGEVMLAAVVLGLILFRLVVLFWREPRRDARPSTLPERPVDGDHDRSDRRGQ